MITLHDRHFKLVVVMWSPFRRIFGVFCDKWDIKTTVIDSFATFFSLSNVKFLSVACDLLNPVQVYHLPSSGNFSVSWRLFNNATIDYFGSTHRPYAILAIVVLVVFGVLPVLILMLYPFRWFQKILNVLPVRWHVLHTFMDSFLGCYKDGTESGTRNCRWFATLLLIVRSFLHTLAIFLHDASYFRVGCIIFTLSVLLVHIVRPFKVSIYTDILTAYILLILIFFSSLIGTQFTSVGVYSFMVFFGLSAFLLAFLSCTSPLSHFSGCRRFGLEVFRRWQVGRQGYYHLH